MKNPNLCSFLLAGIIATAISSAAMGHTLNARSLAFGAVGDGKTDDTAALQRAFSTADGDIVLIPKGTYIVTRTLILDSLKSWTIQGEPGAELKFIPTEGQSICILITGRFFPATRKSIVSLTLTGPNKDMDFPKALGKLVGIKILNAHHGVIDDVLINGFDRAGLEIAGEGVDGGGAFYWDIRHLNSQNNGYGVLCSGLANATNFYGLRASYNLYGIENVQSIIGGSMEANGRSGARFTNPRVKYAMHDVWMEANIRDVNSRGESEIWANSAETFADDNWKPISLSLSGSNRLLSRWTEKDRPQTYTLAGCFDLSVSGTLVVEKRDQPRYHLHPKSRVVDCAVGRHLMDPTIGGGQASDGPFNYARPTWIVTDPKNWWNAP